MPMTLHMKKNNMFHLITITILMTSEWWVGHHKPRPLPAVGEGRDTTLSIQEAGRSEMGGGRLPSELSTLDMTSGLPQIPICGLKPAPWGKRVRIQVFYQVVWLRGDKMTLVAFEELKWIGACHSSRICPAGPTGGSLGRRTV